VEKDIRYVRSAIEDLAFTSRSSRESDGVRRRCCIEHDFVKGFGMQTSTGTQAGVQKIGCERAQFRGAEKGDKGMALKIRTRAEDMHDGNEKP